MKDTTKGPRYSVIPSRAVYDTRLKPSSLRVLCALGVHSDNDGWCFPDQATIARDLQLSRPRVSTAIGQLVGLGYVACEVRVQKGRGKRGLWYRVILDTPGKPPPDEATTSSADVTKRAHRPPVEQNGETGPVFPKANTGAGVTVWCDPMLPNEHTGYIDEQSQLNETPIIPASGDGVKVRRARAKRSAPAKGERAPPGFDEAWAMWTKPGSNRERSLTAWRAHRASGAVKLAAVKAYLGSKQATNENGRFVPYLQNWLRNSLASFVDVAERTAKRKAAEKPAPAPAATPAWDAARKALEAFDGAAFNAYWRDCKPIEEAPLTVVATSELAFDKLTRDHAPKALAALGLAVVVINPKTQQALKALEISASR